MVTASQELNLHKSLFNDLTDLVSVYVAAPLEVTEWREAELVREVLSLPPFLIMLVLVQRQSVSRVLVLIRLVRVLHTCVDRVNAMSNINSYLAYRYVFSMPACTVNVQHAPTISI